MAETRTILIAEDDDSVLKLFELVAKKYGITIVHAQDGTEAYAKIQKQDFDLVITDIKMPKMDGIKFIKKIRALPKFEKFPFFIVSANINEFEPEIAILDRINVIEKPVSIKTIEKIYKSKFGSADKASVTKVDASSINKTLLEDVQEKCALLFQIMAKTKPKVEKLENQQGPKLIEGHFIMFNRFIIMHNHFDVYLTINLNLTKLIFKAFTKSETLNESAADFLNKLSLTLVNKITEAIDNEGLDVTHMTSNFIGNMKEPSSVLINKEQIYNSVIFSNEDNRLAVHVIQRKK